MASSFGYVTNTVEQWNAVKDFAKQNRKDATTAESLLWQELRNRKIAGYKFRRQHPVEGYIPDFICLEKKLIIEIDGGYHNEKEQQEYDTARDAWLNETGYKLLRFTNDEVIGDIQKVLSKIESILLLPSPKEREYKGEVNITATIIEVADEKDIEAGLQKAIDAKDSVGGIVECVVTGMPVGLGEPYFDSLESVLSHALFAIPAVKGVEFGAGFAAAKMFGSEHNDAIENMQGKTRTNHAGGIVGGISNGNDLVFRLAIKPTSSTPKEQNSLNWDTQQTENFSVKGRHDLCVALRAPVIVEAITAIVLTDFMLLEHRIKRIL